MKELMDQCKRGEAIVDMKSLLMKATSNIFNEYFCSEGRKQYTDEEHNSYCENFDRSDFKVETMKYKISFQSFLGSQHWESSGLPTLADPGPNEIQERYQTMDWQREELRPEQLIRQAIWRQKSSQFSSGESRI